MVGGDLPRAILAVLLSGEPSAKVEAARVAASMGRGPLSADFSNWPDPPVRPSRPDKPPLVAPGKVRRRRAGTLDGRIALLHALAHIEFNAIDLAFDMALRFAPDIERDGGDWRSFLRDWLAVGGEEASHFSRLCVRLAALSASYGDLPAHDGLWETAAETSDDVLARLAVAPMALEARGLDVTPSLIDKLRRSGDEESASVLTIIYHDEIGHVSVGVRWFEGICGRRGLDPESTFRQLIAARLAGGLKPPFNHPARIGAGLRPAFYASGS